jgi:hypothetical protein
MPDSGEPHPIIELQNDKNSYNVLEGLHRDIKPIEKLN